MFDPVLTFSAIFHALFLAGAIVFACHRWKLPWRDWPFIVYILVWADLVLAGHFASFVKGLGQLEIYVTATLIALILVLGLYRYVLLVPSAVPLIKPPRLSFATINNPKTRKYLTIFLIGSLAFFALAEIVLGLSVYPDNADSMIYRLPRAFWYVSNGSFLHPFDSMDKRITFYPLDGVALYVPLVLYNLVGTLHTIPSLVTWFMLVYTTYRFARALGAERLIALFATWLVVLTPSILAQSISTNDEILTAVALLVGLYMGWRWMETGGRGYFFLALTSISISVGTKLHIIFLTPIILTAVGIGVWSVWKKPELFQRWIKAMGWRTGITSFLVAVVMIVPFLFYNYISSGRWYFFNDFARDVFNVRASLQGAFQNLLIYLSQMVFSPIADLNFWPVANDRQRFNSALNEIFNPLIKPWIDENPFFYHLSYRFIGVTIPVSVRFVEFSLWSAFVWLLWPLQGRLSLKQAFSLRPLFFLLAMTPPLWLLFWSFSTLYMEGTATYFTYYLICAAPAAVFSFGPIRRALWSEIRWVMITFVMITNFVICFNLIMYSGFRALPDLFLARVWPYDWCLIEDEIIKEIRSADRIRIIFTHEKMPYFAYMHWNPRATYYNPYPIKNLSNPETVLQILPISSMFEFGFMPLKIPGKLAPGLTYLGAVRAIGREAIFAVGNGVEKRHPTESDYIVPHVTVRQAGKRFSISVDEAIAGLQKDDNLEFRYELKLEDELIAQRDWDHDTNFSIEVPNHPAMVPYTLTIIVRSGWSHKELTRATYRVSGRGAWLPDGAEY